MTEATPLKGCPFCGSSATRHQEHVRTRVFCSSPSCPAELSIDSYGNDDAITAWNTRAAPQAPSGGVREAVEHIVERLILDTARLRGQGGSIADRVKAGLEAANLRDPAVSEILSALQHHSGDTGKGGVG